MNKILNVFSSCYRRNFGGCIGSGADPEPERRPVLKPGDELLAAHSVISTFRVSTARPARAPG